MGDRRQFLTAAAAFATSAAISEAAAAAASSRSVTVLTGDTAPARHIGSRGDFYVDLRAHTIYGPKRKTGWGHATNLIDRGGGVGSTDATDSVRSRRYSVLHGPTPPQPRDGVDNDFYIETSSNQLYGPKEGGIWGSPVSLTGAANIALIDGGAP